MFHETNKKVHIKLSVTYTATSEADEDALMAETVSRLTGMKLAF